MEWSAVEAHPPPSFIDLLVTVRYLDAPYDMELGGYDDSKEFWTESSIKIARGWEKSNGKFEWFCGGDVTHWMPLVPLLKNNSIS